jgi:prepilin-type N-terminal cleavage/methylation domain-containing protein
VSSRLVRRRDEAGFTMTELVLTIVILGVIMLPLGNLMLGWFTNSAQVHARIAESHDVQIATAYFAQDVASLGRRNSSDILVQSIWVGSTSGAPYDCGNGTPVVLFASDEFTAPAVSTVVGERRLVRWDCPGPSATQVPAVMAHDLDTIGPGVGCSPNCSAAAPTTVSVALTIKDPGNRGSSYQVTLRGERRQS